MKVFAGWIVIRLLPEIKLQAGTKGLCFKHLLPEVTIMYVFMCARHIIKIAKIKLRQQIEAH